MAELTLSNPAGADGESYAPSIQTRELLYDPTVASTVVVPNGSVLVFYGWYNPTTGTVSTTLAAAGTVPVVRLSTTTANFSFAGVAINAPTNGYLPGSVIQAAIDGVVNVLMDAHNTTAGDLAIMGATTAGAATDSAAVVAGKTIGTVMVTATIGSGTLLVPVLVLPK